LESGLFNELRPIQIKIFRFPRNSRPRLYSNWLGRTPIDFSGEKRECGLDSTHKKLISRFLYFGNKIRPPKALAVGWVARGNVMAGLDPAIHAFLALNWGKRTAGGESVVFIILCVAERI
jgi:hypothetical protein